MRRWARLDFFSQTAPLAIASLMRFLERGVNIARNSLATAGSPAPTVRVKANFCTNLLLSYPYLLHHKVTKHTKGFWAGGIFIVHRVLCVFCTCLYNLCVFAADDPYYAKLIFCMYLYNMLNLSEFI
jgi:hypothetical protein